MNKAIDYLITTMIVLAAATMIVLPLARMVKQSIITSAASVEQPSTCQPMEFDR
jgi:hypothetical protein